MKIFTYLCVLFLIVLGVSFSLLNAGTVTVNYLLGSRVLPISFLIIISAAVGAVLTLFVCVLSVLRHKATSYRLRKKIESLEKTINTLSVNTKE